MRKLMLPFLFLLAACAGKPEEKNLPSAPSNGLLLDMEGLGAIKIGMSQAELEKLLGETVPLTNPTDTSTRSWQDTATIQYQQAAILLDFQRTYASEDSFYMRVIRLRTSSPLCKSRNGIGIGSGRQEIVDAFETEKIYMYPEFENDTSMVRSKILSTIKVRKDREGPEIVFFLKNKKVYAMEAGTFYDDEE